MEVDCRVAGVGLEGSVSLGGLGRNEACGIASVRKMVPLTVTSVGEDALFAQVLKRGCL